MRSHAIFVPVLSLLLLAGSSLAQFATYEGMCTAPSPDYTTANTFCQEAIDPPVNDNTPPYRGEFLPTSDHSCPGLKPLYSDACAEAFAELYCISVCAVKNSTVYVPVPTKALCEKIAANCDPCIEKLAALNPDACGPDVPESYEGPRPVASKEGISWFFDTVLASDSWYKVRFDGTTRENGASAVSGSLLGAVSVGLVVLALGPY